MLLKKENYTLDLSNNINSNKLILPNRVEDIIYDRGTYFFIKVTPRSNLLFSEDDILNNKNILAFKMKIDYSNGIIYELFYIVSHLKDPLNLIDRYRNISIGNMEINTPLFVPRRLIAKVSVENKQNINVLCRCKGYILNGVCVNCNYEDFIKSLHFEIENDELLLNVSDLFVNKNIICGICVACKKCKSIHPKKCRKHKTCQHQLSIREQYKLNMVL